MSESKPFEATASRLERARREGDVLRSADLAAVWALGFATVALTLVVAPLAAATRAALMQARGLHVPLGAYAAIAGLAACVPAAASAGAFVANLGAAGGLQVRFPVAKFERIDPSQGVRRMISSEVLIGASKASLAALALACALVPVARGALSGGGPNTPSRLAAQTLTAIETSLGVAVAIGSVFAWIDLLVERTKRRRRLRMSFDELKRDQKQSEGDPALRGRRRQAHRVLVQGSLHRLSEAALVVTNPSHVAIALAYRPPQIPVPKVLVRAADETARVVKRRAQQLGIPVVEDVALARSLFATTDVGEYIPVEAYVAVAGFVAALMRNGKLRS